MEATASGPLWWAAAVGVHTACSGTGAGAYTSWCDGKWRGRGGTTGGGGRVGIGGRAHVASKLFRHPGVSEQAAAGRSPVEARTVAGVRDGAPLPQMQQCSRGSPNSSLLVYSWPEVKSPPSQWPSLSYKAHVAPY